MAEREVRAAGSADGFGTNGEGAGSQALTPLACGESPSPGTGEGVVLTGAAGVRLGRVAASRWSKGAEERFLEELSGSANVARAAAAAGFSAAAIYKRKLRDKQFAAGWEAAIAVGRSRLEAHLLVAAERSFDPEGLPVAEGEPTVSVSEAISILKHRPAGAGSRAGGGASQAADWEEQSAIGEADYAAATSRIIGRLERLGERTDREKEEAGWTRHGEDWIPPGWVETDG